MTLRWPDAVLKPRDVAFDLAARSLAGPPSINGSAQVVASDAGLWTAAYQAIHVRGRTQVLVWRAMQALLEGRVNPVLVPYCRGYQPFDPADLALLDPVPHDDGTLFDDGTGYAGSLIVVTLDADLPVRAVSAEVTIVVAETIKVGQVFSIGDRLYVIRSVTYADATHATIGFRPPLREAASAGIDLNFDDPVCRMRLATDRELDVVLELHRQADPTVTFIEDV